MWRISGWAFALDQWLKDHIGRPYTLVLGISLGLGISASVAKLGDMIDKPMAPSASAILGLGFTGLVQVALLINQLAQLHEYRQHVRARRAERKERKAAQKAAKTSPTAPPDEP